MGGLNACNISQHAAPTTPLTTELAQPRDGGVLDPSGAQWLNVLIHNFTTMQPAATYKALCAYFLTLPTLTQHATSTLPIPTLDIRNYEMIYLIPLARIRSLWRWVLCSLRVTKSLLGRRYGRIDGQGPQRPEDSPSEETPTSSLAQCVPDATVPLPTGHDPHQPNVDVIPPPPKAEQTQPLPEPRPGSASTPVPLHAPPVDIDFTKLITAPCPSYLITAKVYVKWHWIVFDTNHPTESDAQYLKRLHSAEELALIHHIAMMVPSRYTLRSGEIRSEGRKKVQECRRIWDAWSHRSH